MVPLIHRAALCVTALMLFSALGGPGQQFQRNVSELVDSSVGAVMPIVLSDANNKPTVAGGRSIGSSGGKILTKYRVVSAAHSATMKLKNGSFLAVERVAAAHPEHDIAVSKVTAQNPSFLMLLDSDSSSVAGHLLAIKRPVSPEKSMSEGAINAFSEDSQGRSWIQTAAASSPRNSGGPLLAGDVKVEGFSSLQASDGESIGFAVSIKLLPPLSAKSVPQASGDASELVSSTSSSVTGESVWTSAADGRDYEVRIDGDYIYVAWVNLPQPLKKSSAFSRSELKKNGDKWTGQTTAYMPFDYQHDATKTIWCRVQVAIEIDKVSASKIQGRSQLPSSFNRKQCQPEEPKWKPFTWIPKR